MDFHSAAIRRPGRANVIERRNRRVLAHRRVGAFSYAIYANPLQLFATNGRSTIRRGIDR